MNILNKLPSNPALSEPVSLVVQIKELARCAGFHQIGVTSLKSLGPGEQAVRDWTAEGKHGGMKYLEEFDQRKQNFFKDFPDAASVLVLGVNYYSLEKNQAPSKLSGKVARYAWGRDYHQVIAEKHKKLISEIAKITGRDFRAKSCVDIQPLPEKFAARQAGFGFIGKNTLMLSKEFGPWMFLSEIVMNLDLPEDTPSKGDCGTCSSCQTSCPTGALDQDYKIDARLCIAYLTIEHKGVIPRELRPKMKDWIFGCDDCITVCPFTSKSKTTDWTELPAASGFGPEIKMEEILAIKSNREYEEKFKNSPVSRASRKQLLRNACVVLGNSGDLRAVPWIEKLLRDTSWLVRAHAAWALGRLGGENAAGILEECLRREEEPAVREELKSALNSLIQNQKNDSFTKKNMSS